MYARKRPFPLCVYSVVTTFLIFFTVENLRPAMGWGIDSRNRAWDWVAKLHRLLGRYDNPMPTWFLVPIAGLKLQTLYTRCKEAGSSHEKIFTLRGFDRSELFQLPTGLTNRCLVEGGGGAGLLSWYTFKRAVSVQRKLCALLKIYRNYLKEILKIKCPRIITKTFTQQLIISWTDILSWKLSYFWQLEIK
jgi:hypothetical protein